MINKLHLFIVQNAAITHELKRVLGDTSVSNARSDLERYTDALVKDYIAQIDYKTLAEADRMSEFYRIFYALENDIRALIDSTMSDAHEEGWWDKLAPQEVKQNVKRNKEREESEGIPPRSMREIDYTTFGELGEIIKANWDDFSGIFSNATRGRVLKVINRLNLARGPIAHCNTLPEEEAVRLKITVRDWYMLMD